MRREMSSESVNPKSRSVKSQFDKCEIFVKTFQIAFPFTLLVFSSLPRPAATSSPLLMASDVKSNPDVGATFFDYYEPETHEVIQSLYQNKSPGPQYRPYFTRE